LKHISLSETKRSIEMETEGAIISFTRKMLLRDDLGALADMTKRLGELIATGMEETAYKLLLGAIGSHFASGNNNYQEGASTALDVDSLGTARQLFRDQVDSNNKPIATNPATLLVGTALETKANAIYKDEYFAVGTSAKRVERVFNEFRGSYQPVVSPYMNNTNIKDVDGAAIAGQSALHWFLLSDPNTYPVIEAAFYNGQQTPTVASAEMDFTRLGMQTRAFIDYGFALAETVGGVYSKGEA